MIELASGEGLLSKKYFHNKFDSMEFLDLIDHSETVYENFPKANITKSINFIQAPIDKWQPVGSYDLVFASYAMALLPDD